jgi:hypothetical protein
LISKIFTTDTTFQVEVEVTITATQSEHLKESVANEDTILPAFGMTTMNTDFTFRMPVPEKSAPDSHLEPQPAQSLKQPKGHPDRLSPPNSLEKKRTREDLSSSRDTLMPILLFPPQASSWAVSSASDTAFGKPTMAPPLKRNAKIESFFTLETAEVKAQRNTREFEGIAADKEQQEFHEAHEAQRCKARQHQCDREWPSKHREMVHTQKIADGWQPHQKHVSLL